MMSKGRRKIALAVTGSIAAYKAVEVARRLLAEGMSVVPMMTASAERFLAPLTLSAICGAPVVKDMFDPTYPGEVHVELSRSVDLVLIAPATADVLARLAHGRADDVVSALALAARGPVLAAPAMHTRMWEHPATQRNLAFLRDDGRVKLIGPIPGALASGETGMGRLAEPAEIVDAVLSELAEREDLRGLRIVITAGPTVEDLDPVRFLGNRSSGRMGFAIAERAARRGASVTLIAGPVALETPPGVNRIDVRRTADMQGALADCMGPSLESADALLMAAAVADYAPRETQPTKMKKEGESLALELVKTPDLLLQIGRMRQGTRPVLVGFAVETAEPEKLVAYARTKLAEKKLDMVVANHASDAFGRETNRATFVTETNVEPLAPMTKHALSDLLLDRVKALALASSGSSC